MSGSTMLLLRLCRREALVVARAPCLSTQRLRLSTTAPLGSAGTDHHHCPDYYAVLGLNKHASPGQIKLAYFKKAKKYHPDQNASEEARLMFELAAEAYEVLSDERKRRNFDQYGTPGVRFGGTTSGRGGPGRARGPDSYDPEELYSKIFGEANAEEKADELEYEDFAGSASGHDSTKEYRIAIDFDQAARGAEFRIDLNVKAICWKCEGSGSAPGYTWNVCPYCEGTGLETEKVGHVLTRHPCAHCGGTARFVKYKCDKCEGHGSYIASTTQTVRIPPGSEDGQVFRFEVDEVNLKACVPGTQEKYFYVYLTVQDSPHYDRDDLHLHSESDVSLSQALLGGHILVRGLHRPELWLEVPAMFDPSQSLVAPGEGIPRSDGADRGHHFVKVGLRAPARLSPAQREIMLEFARLEPAREGTVDGLEGEQADAHRFTTDAVEPRRVQRTFNVDKKLKEEEEEDDAAAGTEGRGDRGRRWQQQEGESFWTRFRRATFSDVR